ncbi:MAG: hypothetical protein JNL74_05770, partial [Fibrobacteres bacterium]|nr:hypothetical protein [Fibrobacterota bacterium]
MDKANPKSSRNLIKPELSWHNYTNPLSGEFTLLNKPFAELTYSERILVVDYALFKLEAKVDNRSRFDFNNSSFSALMNKDTLKVINDAIGQVQDETNKSDYLSLANYLGIDAKQFNRPALKKLRKSLVVYLQKHPIRERNDNDE